MRRFPSALLLVGWLLLACFTGTTSAGYIGSFAKWGLKASKAVILSLSGWVLDPPKSTPVEAATEPSSTFTQAPSMMADRGVDPRHKTVTTGLGLGRSPVLDPEPTTVPPLHQAIGAVGPGSSPSSLDVLLEAGALKKGRYSTCWRAAVMELETSCADLDGPMTQRFALELSRCHLGDLGRSLPPSCGKEDLLLGACLRDLDEISLLTFTEFFTYCGSVCFFVRADVAQAQTETVIMALTSRTIEAVELLHRSHELQHDLLAGQEQSARVQEELRDLSLLLKGGLDDSLGLIGSLRDEFEGLGREIDRVQRAQQETLAHHHRLQALLEESSQELRRHAEHMENEFAKEAERLRSAGEVVERMMAGLWGVWRSLLYGLSAAAVIAAAVCLVVLLYALPSPWGFWATVLLSVAVLVIGGSSMRSYWDAPAASSGSRLGAALADMAITVRAKVNGNEILLVSVAAVLSLLRDLYSHGRTMTNRRTTEGAEKQAVQGDQAQACASELAE